MPLPNLSFTVLDTETTGFIPRTNRVIEFASMRLEGGKIVDRFEELIAIPKNDVPPVIQVLTRIRPDALAGKPTFEECKATILEKIGEDTMIVGQNVSFDIKMLKGEGMDLSGRPWIDTSMLASIVFPELASYSLSYVSTVLKLNHEPVHRAMGDVVATLELLERCWDRILELPQDKLDQLRDAFARSSPGYKLLAGALSKQSTAKKLPNFLKSSAPLPPLEEGAGGWRKTPVSGASSDVTLLTETLNPQTLRNLIQSAESGASTTWIAVKNLENALRRLGKLPDAVRVLHPPFLLLDPAAAKRLEAQEVLTSDEASVLVKLQWYMPRAQGDIPIHGDERAVWNGKLAATDTSDVYLEQFKNLPAVILLDQRQLLRFLSDPTHEAHGALQPGMQMMIDDASILEDTATKAYGWSVSLDGLRAAAEGNPDLVSFTDLLQIWIEKMRNFQDLRYIVKMDLETKEAKSLRERIPLLDTKETPLLLKRILENIDSILTLENLQGRITWIEQRQNGSQFLESVPERVGDMLQTSLYKTHPTTLLLPAGPEEDFREILPPGTEPVRCPALLKKHPLSMDFPDSVTLETIMKNPPEGKTVVLVGSRKTIEDAFVRHMEALEEKNVTLICQNLSGGQERMQAEFTATESPTLWLLTPWTYEGVELQPGTVDNLIVFSLPFDHPNHAVLSRRALHYRDAFGEYSLPRLKARMFRILRTFARHATENAEVQICDDRLRTKKYGKEVRAYLEQYAADSAGKEPEVGQMRLL